MSGVCLSINSGCFVSLKCVVYNDSTSSSKLLCVLLVVDSLNKKDSPAEKTEVTAQ